MYESMHIQKTAVINYVRFQRGAMKRLLIFMSILLLPACEWWSSKETKVIQGAGKMTRQERPIKDVEELQIGGVGKVVVKQGNEESLVITGDALILPHIISEVDEGTLYIKPADDLQLRSKSEIVYQITVKSLKEIGISGAVELESPLLTSQELKLDCSGATRAQLAVAVDTLKVHVCGSAKLSLEGEAKKQKVETSGSAQYDAGALQSDRAKVTTEGASHVTIAVGKKLEVNSSGVSVVTYHGNPLVKVHSSGASSVEKVG